MRVGWNLLNRQRYLFRAASLRQNKSVTLMNRNPTPQIRQRKGRLSIAAVSRSDQLEQCFVLGNWQELSFAEHPARRRKVAGEHSDFAYVWLCHRKILLIW